MEETKNKEGAENSKSDANKNGQKFDFGNLEIPEWLTHLLTGAGSMGATYFLWIKPIFDQYDAMKERVAKLENRVKELEEEQNKIILHLKKEDEQTNEFKGKENDYFTFRGKNGNGRYVKM